MPEQPPRVEVSNIIESDRKADKERLWENKLKELDEVGDAIGNGIDERIKETVAAFNLNGFNTNQSCEGHHDGWGMGAPWVGIEAPNEPEERYVNENKIYREVADRYGISFEDVKKANNESAWVEAIKLASENAETPEFQEWRKENQRLRNRAEKLVNDFYKNYVADPQSRLEFENIGGDDHFRIHNGGKDYAPWDEMSEEQKKGLEERLVKHQKEMNEFAKFLKDRFFNE